jgi:hypothetical protein
MSGDSYLAKVLASTLIQQDIDEGISDAQVAAFLELFESQVRPRKEVAPTKIYKVN